MAVFRDGDEVYATIGELFRRMVAHPELGPRFQGLNMSFAAHFTDPDATLGLDCRNGDATVAFAELDFDPDATLTMAADAGNKFWLGKLNLPLALTRGQIKTSGKGTKAMKLLPVLRPVFAMYEDLLREIGREDLIAAGNVK